MVTSALGVAKLEANKNNLERVVVPEKVATEASGKQPYRKPKVEEFGSVLELTAGVGAVPGDTVVTLSVTAC